MSIRTIKLHHPTGHPYWTAEEYGIELPDGTFFNKQQFTTFIPEYAIGTDYCDAHRIIVKDDGIYYQRCGASSGSGKTNYKEPFKIIDKKYYDSIEYVGSHLPMSDELIQDLKENGIYIKSL